MMKNRSRCRKAAQTNNLEKKKRQRTPKIVPLTPQLHKYKERKELPLNSEYAVLAIHQLEYVKLSCVYSPKGLHI